MPCKNSAHSHEWIRNGVLAIEKCECLCGFCKSDKEYKPASALRKHVLIHIRNDSMPLSLAHSSGGRPKLRAISPLRAVESNGGSRSTSPAITSTGSPSPQNSGLSLGPSSPGMPLAAADNESLEALESPRPHHRGYPPSEGDLPRSCWRCMIFQLECNRAIPCSECQDQDPQLVCSAKNLEDCAPQILADEMQLPGPMHWQCPHFQSSGLSITFEGAAEPLVDAGTKAFALIPNTSCSRLLAFCRSSLWAGDKLLNDKLFDDKLGIEQILYAAALFTILREDIDNVVRRGLKCLSFLLRVLGTVQGILHTVAADRALIHDKQWKYKVVGESLPDFKSELRSFLSSLQMKAVYTSRLLIDGDIDLAGISFPEDSDLVREAITKDLQLFYGILILFIVRASLRALLNCSTADFHAVTLEAGQDPTFELGFNCSLYHPMLYALGGSKVTFGSYLSIYSADKDITDLQKHFEIAASLMPVSPEAPILEHVAYFFNQSAGDSDPSGLARELRRRATDALAQFATLPMA